MEEKTCLGCGIEITGRIDKKFCSDQCRNNYNNSLNSDSTDLVRHINKILRKNRRILAGLNPNGKSKATKDEMINKGFNFKFFTNVYKTKGGNVYYFCYEQGYLPLENGQFALVVRQEYVS